MKIHYEIDIDEVAGEYLEHSARVRDIVPSELLRRTVEIVLHDKMFLQILDDDIDRPTFGVAGYVQPQKSMPDTKAIVAAVVPKRAKMVPVRRQFSREGHMLITDRMAELVEKLRKCDRPVMIRELGGQANYEALRRLVRDGVVKRTQPMAVGKIAVVYYELQPSAADTANRAESPPDAVASDAGLSSSPEAPTAGGLDDAIMRVVADGAGMSAKDAEQHAAEKSELLDVPKFLPRRPKRECV